MFIEIGMGIDLHGQSVTKAAVRAVQNAIHHNSMPGLRMVLPENDINNMKVNVRLAIPTDKENLDLSKLSCHMVRYPLRLLMEVCLRLVALFLRTRMI